MVVENVIMISVIGFLLVCVIFLVYRYITMLEQYQDVVTSLQNDLTDYENFIQTFSDNLTLIDNQLKQIDSRGSFATDDELGSTFQTIKIIMGKLQEFNINKYGEKTKTEEAR